MKISICNFLVVVIFILSLYLLIKNRMIVENTSSQKVYIADTMIDYTITQEVFRDKMFIKRKELSVNELYFWKNGTLNGAPPRWAPAWSPFIVDNFNNIPDTIFADGYFTLNVNVLWGWMVEDTAYGVRLHSYQTKQVKSK